MVQVGVQQPDPPVRRGGVAGRPGPFHRGADDAEVPAGLERGERVGRPVEHGRAERVVVAPA